MTCVIRMLTPEVRVVEVLKHENVGSIMLLLTPDDTGSDAVENCMPCKKVGSKNGNFLSLCI